MGLLDTGESPRSVMDQVLDCSLEVQVPVTRLRSLWKSCVSSYPSSYGLNSITAIFFTRMALALKVDILLNKETKRYQTWYHNRKQSTLKKQQCKNINTKVQWAQFPNL